MTFIYMLTDPFPSCDTCYVGKTRLPKMRMYQHATDFPNRKMRQWVTALAIQGKKPIMTIVAECEDREAEQAELDSIAMIRATRGPSCLNVKPFCNEK